MLHHFPFYLSLILLIIILIIVADRIRVAYPILLVLGGLGLSFIPSVPDIEIDPELIFIIFLPPLLSEAAWSISWKELWKWRRIITSFAFLIVFLTAFVVALVANSYIPGFSLALGFLLGGIVSPPDAVSAGAIMKFVHVPSRYQSIIEGESLLNDASSLIVFRFALIAVGTGQFIWHDAISSFGWMVFGGVGIGLAVVYGFFKAHRLLPTDVNMDIVLTLVAPYMMYIAAETVHSSGVMAVVSGGLFLAQRKHLFLNSSGRIKGFSVWESLCFVLNGLVFMIIGLALPTITKGLGNVSVNEAIGYGVLITVVLMVSRILSAYGAVVTTLIARNFITVAEKRNPGYKAPLVIGWAGMRGVVSLAAALSIPETLENGVPFPQRNLILFITFIVILLTLLIQGLTLPILIKKINLLRDNEVLPGESHYQEMYRKLTNQSLEYLHSNYEEQITRQPILNKIVEKWEEEGKEFDNIRLDQECKLVYVDMINHQREWLREWNKDHEVDENIVRRHLYRLDLEEEKLKYR